MIVFDRTVSRINSHCIESELFLIIQQTLYIHTQDKGHGDEKPHRLSSQSNQFSWWPYNDISAFAVRLEYYIRIYWQHHENRAGYFDLNFSQINSDCDAYIVRRIYWIRCVCMRFDINRLQHGNECVYVCVCINQFNRAGWVCKWVNGYRARVKQNKNELKTRCA